MSWFLADATAAFFGKKEWWLGGVWQPPPAGDLAGEGEQPLVTTLLLDGGFPTPQEPFEDEEGESLMREGEFGSQLQRKAGTAEKLPKASPTFSITSAFYPCQTVSCPLSRPSGRQTDWRQEEEVRCCDPSCGGTGQWEFVQRNWAVPVAQSHWHCFHEGHVFFWLTRGGKDS